MIATLKKLFGVGPATDYKALVAQGAVILDVRTKMEYQQGHIKGSINVPLNGLQAGIGKLKKDKPVITCCASGMRSAQAKGMLESYGFKEVYNGGGWFSLNSKIK